MRNRSSLSHIQKPVYDATFKRFKLKYFDDLERSFGVPQPLLVEIGFGNGRLLWQFAKQYPYWNCLGIDVYKPGIATLMKKCVEFDIKNVRILQDEGITVLEQLPDRCIDKVWVFFPDPWPKTKHHKRRLVNDEFVEVLETKLKANRSIHLATDWDDYAHQIECTFAKHKIFSGGRTKRPDHRPISKYERRAIELDHNLHFFQYTRLTEEIDLPPNRDVNNQHPSAQAAPASLSVPPQGSQ